ncbi:MAG TPA: HEAT repeat domain-containing protein, partial [Planctomycetaceae bacterium]|nr:HEAT repeat domain-containing protein [Planctomycetaceae bacterium]
MNDDLSALCGGLSDADTGRRAAAAERLARLGPAGRGAAVPLVRASGDADESVREWAVAALEELGPPDVGDVGALAALLAEHNTER